MGLKSYKRPETNMSDYRKERLPFTICQSRTRMLSRAKNGAK